MNQDRAKRKLTAIFSADVVGYSRLMEEDEAWTIQNLQENKRLISKFIEEYQGRVIDAPGDNLLAEFNSVINAVECAVKIQEKLKKKNDHLIESNRMHFRIGVNLGDVVEEDGRIYGNGVNIAARLEGLTDPGGICISRRTYDHVKTRLDLGYEYLGEHNVKNISEPVRVYRVLMGSENAGKVVGEKKASKMVSRRLAMTTIIALIIIAVGSLIWNIYSNPSRKLEQATEPEQTPIGVDVKETIESIAVLPFTDLSPDSDQEYFVDGLIEELLNSLAQINGLNVTGRTSSFSFKGSNKTVQEIAEVLGVENILEGSVRKAGNELRITAQLLRGADGFHLWSKTYDREFEDIFEVQEDIATEIARKLKITLGIDDSIKILGGTENQEAYELYLISLGGKQKLQELQSMQDVSDAISRAASSIDDAIELDPNFALAWALKAKLHNTISTFVPSDLTASERDAAEQAALKAIEIEPDLADGYFPLGVIKQSNGNWIEAEVLFRKGMARTPVSINPEEYGMPQRYWAVGQLTKCHELLQAARLNDPLNSVYRAYYIWSFGFLGNIQRIKEEYERSELLFGKDFTYDIFLASRICAGEFFSRDEMIECFGTDPTWSEAKEHLGSAEEMLAWLRQIYAENDGLSSAEFCFLSLFAAYYGDPEFSMDALEKGVALEAQGIFWAWAPVFQEVRQLPRFKEYVKKIGLVDYWEKFDWPDICRPLENGDFECD